MYVYVRMCALISRDGGRKFVDGHGADGKNERKTRTRKDTKRTRRRHSQQRSHRPNRHEEEEEYEVRRLMPVPEQDVVAQARRQLQLVHAVHLGGAQLQPDGAPADLHQAAWLGCKMNTC